MSWQYTGLSAAWISSTLSFSSFWLFCSSPPLCNWHLELLARRRKFSILSSHLLQNCHIGLWCHGCLICPFPRLKLRKLRAAHIMATQVPENFVWGKLNAPQHVVPDNKNFEKSKPGFTMSSPLIVVPGHKKQTLLKQCLVSQTSLIISKLGVPVATHSCPPPALSSSTTSMFFTILAAVLFYRGQLKVPYYSILLNWTLIFWVFVGLEPSGTWSSRRRESNALAGYTTGPSLGRWVLWGRFWSKCFSKSFGKAVVCWCQGEI